MNKVSQQFLIRLKLHESPAYKLAQQAGVDPNTLSRLINGIDPVRPGDQRIVAVGRVLGVPAAQCFTKEGTSTLPAKTGDHRE